MRTLIAVLFAATLAFAQWGMGPGPGVKSYSGGGSGITSGAITDSGAKTAQTYSFSHACEAGSNYLVVRLITFGGASGTLTWNTSESMTREIRNFDAFGRCEIDILANPTTGTHSVGVTLDAASVNSRAWAQCLTGVNVSGGTAGAVDDSNHSQGTGGTITVAVTPTQANDYLLDAMFAGFTATSTPTGSGQTKDFQQTNASSSGSGSHLTDASTGAYSFGWGTTGSSWADCGVALKAAP